MGTDIGSKVGKIAKVALFEGQAAAVTEAQRHLIPHILDIFTDHDHEEVYRFIITDYPLVREETPEPVKNALHNLSQNGMLRDRYHHAVLNTVTPENVLEWLNNPGEWLDEEDADEVRIELEMCAVIIEETPGGREWLERQVFQIYRYANIVPEDSTLGRENA